MQLPRVIRIKLVITPTSVSDVSCLYLGIVNKNSILEQQVGNTVASLLTASLNGGLLITTAAANARFVFEVVTEEPTKLQVVRSLYEREVIFPNVEIFTVRPRRLVPDVGISACTPE